MKNVTIEILQGQWTWKVCMYVKVQSHYSIWHQRLRACAHTLINVRGTLGIRHVRYKCAYHTHDALDIHSIG